MKRNCNLLLVLTSIMIATFSLATMASNEDEPVRWELKELYVDQASWSNSHEKMLIEIGTLKLFRGSLSKSPQQLQKACDAISVVRKEINRLQTFAYLKNTEDSRVEINQTRLSKADMMMSC